MRCTIIDRPLAPPVEILSRPPSNQRPSFQRCRRLPVRVGFTPSTTALPCSPVIRPASPSAFTAIGGARGSSINRRVCSHLDTATHEPFGHEGLPFDAFLPPWHHTHPADARMGIYWWICGNIRTRWLDNCPECQSRNPPRLTAHWSTISMPPLAGTAIAISVDCKSSFGQAPG